MVRRLEDLFADRGLRHDGLDEARAVAKRQKVDFAARPLVVKPALDRDVFAGMLADVFNVNVHQIVPSRQSPVLSPSKRRRASRARASASFAGPRLESSKLNAPS